MECKVGLSKYNSGSKKPLILEGGHTFGKHGLASLRNRVGPDGRTPIRTDISSLKPNYGVNDYNNKAEKLRDTKMEQEEEKVAFHGEDGKTLLLPFTSKFKSHKGHKFSCLTTKQSDLLYSQAVLMDQIEDLQENFWTKKLGASLEEGKAKAIGIVDTIIKQEVNFMLLLGEQYKCKIRDSNFLDNIPETLKKSTREVAKLEKLVLDTKEIRSNFISSVGKDNWDASDSFFQENLEFTKNANESLKRIDELLEDRQLPTGVRLVNDFKENFQKEIKESFSKVRNSNSTHAHILFPVGPFFEFRFEDYEENNEISNQIRPDDAFLMGDDRFFLEDGPFSMTIDEELTDSK